MEESLLDRVLHCATKVSKYLPPLLPGATWGPAVVPALPGVGTSVLVSSLSTKPLQLLKRAYRLGQTKGNAQVIFHRCNFREASGTW